MTRTIWRRPWWCDVEAIRPEGVLRFAEPDRRSQFDAAQPRWFDWNPSARTVASRRLDFVRRKRMWVYQQLARKEATSAAVRPREFVDGEGFAYLGRSYRLKLVPPGTSTSAVKLVGWRFVMPSTFAPDGRTHLIRWYSDRARLWLAHKVKAYSARMEVDPTGVRVQDLGYRWGSCGKRDWLYFHWKWILLPAPIVEYVVVHEMANLHEPHHTPAFWSRVERAMPDHEQRRGWLESHGLEVEGLYPASTAAMPCIRVQQ